MTEKTLFFVSYDYIEVIVDSFNEAEGEDFVEFVDPELIMYSIFYLIIRTCTKAILKEVVSVQSSVLIPY